MEHFTGPYRLRKVVDINIEQKRWQMSCTRFEKKFWSNAWTEPRKPELYSLLRISLWDTKSKALETLRKNAHVKMLHSKALQSKSEKYSSKGWVLFAIINPHCYVNQISNFIQKGCHCQETVFFWTASPTKARRRWVNNFQLRHSIRFYIKASRLPFSDF